MNISEIEKITGISKQAIRFYEKEGLISPKRNQDNQYREYDENDVKTLKMIYVFRKVGLSLDEISKVLKDEISINDAMNKRRAEIIKERKEQEQLMRNNNVPEWFVWTCKKIKYLFPKAHATAYVIMALRIGWFKVHRPIYYYAAYFSCRASAFDVDVLAAGKNAIRNKINEIQGKIANKTAENKEVELLSELQIALEMCLRGYTFKQVDINESEVKTFVISKDKKSLLLPFTAVSGLGEAAAVTVIEARKAYPFTSKEDVQKRTKLNKTHFEKLRLLGSLDDLPDKDTSSLL